MVHTSLSKNVAILYLRMIFVLVISLFTTRLVLQNLGIESYGIYNVVGSVVSLFTFLQTAISSANYRYLAFAIGKGDKKLLSVTFKTSIILALFISLMVLLLAETIGLWYINNYLNVPVERFISARNTFQISTITCIVTTLYMPFYSNVISHEKMAFFAYLSIFECISKVIIAISIAYSSYDKLEFYSSLILIIQICILFAYYFFSRINFEEVKGCNRYKIDKSLLKSMSGFSCWTLFVAIADLCSVQGINIIINIFFTPIVNAARGIVVQIQGAVDQFRGNLQTAINPQITKSFATGENYQMFRLMSASGRFSSYVMLLITIPICFTGNYILKIWLHEVPPYTSIFLIYVLAACIIDGISNPFVTAICATGDIKKFQFFVGICKFMTLPISYFSLKLGGTPITLFQIFLLMTILTVSVRITICSKKINIPLKKICLIIVAPCISVALISCLLSWGIYCLLTPETFSVFVLYIVLTSLINLIVIFFIGITSNERFLCLQFAKNKFIKMNIVYKLKRLIDKLTQSDKKYTSIVSKEAPWVYISYIPEVFYKQNNLTYMNGHQSRREAIEMVKCFNELGYNVFMSNSTCYKFPKIDVKLVFGIEPAFTEACRKYPKAKKVYYATGAYYGHQNSMIELRTKLFNLKHKVDYPLLRLVKPDERLDLADEILQIGSKFTIKTYPEIYQKKITTINQSCILTSSHSIIKHGCDYMWLGGGGAVLKGLDLVLDYFIEHKDKKVHIIGNIEKEFLSAYSHMNMENIFFYGHMDVSSDSFLKVASQCSYMIYPSCTEGGVPGSVITGMYYGLIPIVSKWASFNEIEKYGYLIQNNSMSNIEEAIKWSEELSVPIRVSLCKKCMQFSQNTFNINNYKIELLNYFNKTCQNIKD